MALTREQSLREAIANEETRLAGLAQKHNESRRRLAELKQELATIDQHKQTFLPRQYSITLMYPPPQKEKSIYSASYSVAVTMSTQSYG